MGETSDDEPKPIVRIEIAPDGPEGHYRCAPARFQSEFWVGVDPGDPRIAPGAGFEIRFDPDHPESMLIAFATGEAPSARDWFEPGDVSAPPGGFTDD